VKLDSRKIFLRIFLFVLFSFLIWFTLLQADDNTLYLDTYQTYEFMKGIDNDTILVTGGIFRQGAANLIADTTFWLKRKSIILIGDVVIWDTLYGITGDKVVYNLNSKTADVFGDSVTITSKKDSILAVGTNAWYSRDSAIVRMHDRPTVFLNYPDSSNQIRVDADRIAINADDKISYADGKVVIDRADIKSWSERAIMYIDGDNLILLDNPIARRRDSEIRGDTIIISGENSLLKKIDVYGNAEGDFKEPKSNDTTLYDLSELKASEIKFNFIDGALDNVIAIDQAYSFYSPGSRDSSETEKNIVSGDTIKLFMKDENLHIIEVLVGAEGKYLSKSYHYEDSLTTFLEDTVQYTSEYINYSIDDSTIRLEGKALVENKSVSLSAHKINYITSSEVVTAFSDSLDVDSSMIYVPVVLKDGSEEIFGSYLEYSMDTEKGLIRRSKSEYSDAYYRGGELFRTEEDVFFVDDGRYTSCDLDEPHFHFRFKKMKMIRNDKFIVRPVVFYIEKLPLFIFPFYISPVEKERHSGFLSFKYGNFERGNRRLTNVGYYWAASEYWDIMGAADYYEDFGFTYRSVLRYNQRYKLSGTVSGSYANESRYVGFNEMKTKRWRLSFNHSQTISPTFSIRANGNFLSDKSYYTDYSTNLEDRLNRSIRSQVSMSKRWSSASLSAQVIHTVNLDKETRSDNLPTASLSFPSKPIFGSPTKDEMGRTDRKWYHNFYYKYGVGLNNYSYRSTDTTGFRSRKKYITMNHNSSLSASFAILTHLKINPSFRYQETWYKIFETDQSQQAGIDASESYRRYSYSGAISASTNLYGTLNTNILGLLGLRHVLTPRISYSQAPEITRHDDIKKYTGVGSGGGKQRMMSMSMGQLFQVKVKSGDNSRKIDLFSVNSSVSYNFESKGKKFSYLSTNAHTSLLKNISLSASMVHDLYEPNTEELRWWSPYLLNFTVSTRFHTSGFLEKSESSDNKDGLPSPLAGLRSGESGTKQKWDLSVSHHYSESGRERSFTKRHTINFTSRINLSSSIELNYSQSYDIVRDVTVSRRIEIRKNLHCWRGNFSWNINGSNKGYSFMIYVIAMPDIKFEKTMSNIRDAFF
jgi:lipopolysaccharide assembly outer membrane protein LptD (OstA)